MPPGVSARWSDPARRGSPAADTARGVPHGADGPATGQRSAMATHNEGARRGCEGYPAMGLYCAIIGTGPGSAQRRGYGGIERAV